jgi:hypothetical protein
MPSSKPHLQRYLAPPFRGGWEGSGQYKGKLTLFNQTPLIPLRGTLANANLEKSAL